MGCNCGGNLVKINKDNKKDNKNKKDRKDRKDVPQNINLFKKLFGN